MRIFQTREFKKRAAACNLTDEHLIKCIQEFEQGLRGDSLGGNLYKKRIAARGGGKSGGFRTILLYQDSSQRIFCLHIFSKKEKTDLNSVEIESLIELGKKYLQLSTSQLEQALEIGNLQEIVR